MQDKGIFLKLRPPKRTYFLGEADKKVRNWPQIILSGSVCVSAGYVVVGVLLIIFVKIKNYLSIKSTDSEQENCHHTDGFGCWQGTNPYIYINHCGRALRWGF